MSSKLTLIILRYTARCFLLGRRRAVNAVHKFLMFPKLIQKKYKSELKYANILRCQRNKWTRFGTSVLITTHQLLMLCKCRVLTLNNEFDIR